MTSYSRNNRSKSTPAPKTAERRRSKDFLEELDEDLTDLADRITHQKPRKKKRIVQKSSLDNRPPWNNDTRIEGYEDVDEKGKIRRRDPVSYENKNKARVEQEALTKQWMESLRGGHYEN
ncbi:hypothetical protein WR25_16122 [Diploscapter pachys]|uniref:Uncharacterized protein n=1 Tax=Diploscapter pachys TaxID=2018661 RepID=A0A2A2LBB8_9BILA|nr:hypothetical protein WR25_16122 [Diploscapter pachys]